MHSVDGFPGKDTRTPPSIITTNLCLDEFIGPVLPPIDRAYLASRVEFSRDLCLDPTVKQTHKASSDRKFPAQAESLALMEQC